MIILSGKGLSPSKFVKHEDSTLADDLEGVHGQHEVMTRVFGPTWCVWIVPGTLAAD